VINDGNKLDFKKIGLSDIDLDVMALHYYDGWSYREIAEAYGIHKQSIADRINKCKRILKTNAVPCPKQLQRPNQGERVKVISLDPSHFDLFASQPIEEMPDEDEI